MLRDGKRYLLLLKFSLKPFRDELWLPLTLCYDDSALKYSEEWANWAFTFLSIYPMLAAFTNLNQAKECYNNLLFESQMTGSFQDLFSIVYHWWNHVDSLNCENILIVQVTYTVNSTSSCIKILCVLEVWKYATGG